MDANNKNSSGTAERSLLLNKARWPGDFPLTSREIRVAEQHSILDINRFVAQHALPQGYRPLFPGLIIPLAAFLLKQQRHQGRPLIVGVSGSQGSGKSTLAQALHLVLTGCFAARSCVLSLDDFYLSQARRKRLATEVHPLLATRGVPGTHDTSLLAETLEALVHSRHPVALPRFDKSTDDPLPQSKWPTTAPGVELIIVEGWCVGTQPQSESELARPVNRLEQEEDSAGVWRRFVNTQLSTGYRPIFDSIQPLIYLQAPAWEAVYRWRSRQEQKLIKSQGEAYRGGLDSDERLRRFISHYQRLTEAMLRELPEKAEITIKLNQAQQFSQLKLKANND